MSMESSGSMSGPSLTLSDAEAVEFGFATAPAPTPNVEPVAETPKAADATLPATAESEQKPIPEATPNVEQTPAQDADQTGKQFYTPEEVERLLMSDGNLDSNRLSPEGKILQKSFQRGFGPKFEQAKRMREDAERQLAEIRRLQHEKEEQEIFAKESEELGEEAAAMNKRMRDMESRLQAAEHERMAARQSQLAMEIRNEFKSVSPTHFVPQTQEFEDMILAAKWAQDMSRTSAGMDPMTMEEAVKSVADSIGLTNAENMKRLIKSNPAVYKEVSGDIINEYLKSKAAGPTTTSSSAASVQTTPTAAAKEDPNEDTFTATLRKLGINPNEEIHIVPT